MSFANQWPDADVERLKDLWGRGQSAGQICRQMTRYSRSAIIGKVHRLEKAGDIIKRVLPTVERLPYVRKARAVAAPRAPAKKKPDNNFAAINADRRAKNRERDIARSTLPADRVRAFPFARPWTERRAGQCAFPASGDGADTFSCCARTERIYCVTCEAVMYQPQQPTLNKTMRIARLAA